LPDVPLQMIAVADNGRVAATFPLDPDRFTGSALEIAGDELTAEQIASAFGRHAGCRRGQCRILVVMSRSKL
jgi:hypothetical protein